MTPPIRCQYCRRTLAPGQALAYWPRSRPGFVRYVCRPALWDKWCFREAVPGAATYAIAPATQVTP